MKVIKENSNSRTRDIITARAMELCFPFLYKSNGTPATSADKNTPDRR